MTHLQKLLSALADLVDTPNAAFELVEFTTTLAKRCAEILGIDDVYVVSTEDSEAPRVIGSSSDRARPLAVSELQDRVGPSFDCYRRQEQIVNDQMARWPRFGVRANQAGFTMVHALPMRRRDEAIGAVTMLSPTDRPLSPDEVSLGQALADMAGVGIFHQRELSESAQLAGQLQTALDSRVIIEQAKGMLAERRKIDPDEALTMLRSYARRSGQPLSRVASQLIDGALTLG